MDLTLSVGLVAIAGVAIFIAVMIFDLLPFWISSHVRRKKEGKPRFSRIKRYFKVWKKRMQLARTGEPIWMAEDIVDKKGKHEK